MIKKVILENFQSHKKTELDMEKLTVLTGGSNSGKSAVLRALGGLLRNDAVGDYVHHGTKSLVVTLVMEDDTRVEWEKGSGTNQYKIIFPDGTDEKFEKVGADLPEEVAKVIGIAPILMEGGQKLHINLHEQLESPFLVSKEHTAGFAAKVFGEVTSAAKLQAAIQEGNKLNRADLLSVKHKRADVSALDAKLLGFSSLDKDKSSLEKATQLISSAKGLISDKETAEYLINTLSAVEEDLEEISDKEKELESYANVDLSGIEGVVSTLTSVSNIHTKLEAIDERLGELTKFISLVGDLDDSQVQEAQSLMAGAELISNLLLQISKADSDLSELTSIIATGEEKIAAREEKVMSLMSELEECPTCRQELTEGAKNHLLGVSHV